jgi:alpha-L-fucosidase 2
VSKKASLSCVPHGWPDGHVRGLKARGGFVVDLAWQNGQSVQAKIKSLQGNPTKVRFGKHAKEFKTQAGQEYRLEFQLQ